MGLPVEEIEKLYTYGDYLKWPDNERWELIKGFPYSMSPAPSSQHQIILGEIFGILWTFFKGKPCKPFLAPFDVRLPAGDESDEKTQTVVQPDLTVICDKSKIDSRGCKGTPDLIIEILSPSSAARDTKEKLQLYQEHGVKEYWLVYPFEQSVDVLVLGKEGKYLFPEKYAGDDVIEVKLFPGLKVDLGTVFDIPEEDREEGPPV